MRQQFLFLSWLATLATTLFSPLSHAQFGPEFSEPELVAARENPEPMRLIFGSDTAPDRRERAYRLLVTAQATGFEQIIREARFDPLPAIRVLNVHHLGLVFKDEKLVEEYLHLANDKNSGARYNAAEALQRFPSKKVLPSLLELLGDEGLEVRDCAAFSLWRWNWPDMQKRFQSVADSTDLRRAGCAATFLVNYYDQKVDGDVLDRYLAAELDRLTGPPYRGNDNVVRIIQALGKQRKDSSLSILEKALTHSHRSIRAEAEKASAQIRLKK